MKKRILGNDDANNLFSLEEDNLGPCDELSEKDYIEFKEEVIGNTLWGYCKWRWPDSPKKQLELALEVLN